MSCLLVLSHPDFSNSFANKFLLSQLQSLLPNLQVDNIDEQYPTLKFDLEKEQQKLVESEVIIFQFPMYWYNAPSSLRKWIEDVFKHGFSHGSSGKALNGKKLVVSVTTGAPGEFYEGAKDCVENLLHGFECLCKLCGMKYLGVAYTCGVSYLIRDKPELLEQRKGDLKKQANKIVELIKSP